MSSKVHGAQRVLMNLDRLCQCLMVSPITLPGGMASFSTAGIQGEEERGSAAFNVPDN